MLLPNITQEQFGSLDPVLQAEYTVQADGKYRLSVQKVGTWELADTGGLLSALSDERSKRAGAEELARTNGGKLEGIDLPKLQADSTKLADLLAKGDPSETLKARQDELEAEFQRKQALLIDQHRQELATRDERITGISSQLDREQVDNEATRQILAIDPKASPQMLLLT